MNIPSGSPTETRSDNPRTWMRFSGAVAVAIALAVGLLALVFLLARPLGILILGIAIAAALAPVVRWLERWLPRPAAVVLLYLLLLLVISALVVTIVLPLLSQSREVSERLPEYIDQLQRWFENQAWIRDAAFFDTVFAQVSQVSAGLLSLPVSIFSAGIEILLIFVISIYALLEAQAAQRFIQSLIPPDLRERAHAVHTEMIEAMGGFVRGMVVDIFLIGLLTYLGLLIIGVNYPLVLGVVAGLLEILPLLGPVMASIPIVIVALLQSPTTAVAALVFVVILQQVESNILIPNIMHQQANISPLLVILAFFGGSAIGGVLGALVAIPLVAALRVFTLRVLVPLVRRQQESAATPTPHPESS